MKGKMVIEIQHEGKNVTTEQLQKVVRQYLKEAGYILSHYQIFIYYIPASTQTYLRLESLKEDQIIELNVPTQELLTSLEN